MTRRTGTRECAGRNNPSAPELRCRALSGTGPTPENHQVSGVLSRISSSLRSRLCHQEETRRLRRSQDSVNLVVYSLMFGQSGRCLATNAPVPGSPTARELTEADGCVRQCMLGPWSSWEIRSETQARAPPKRKSDARRLCLEMAANLPAMWTGVMPRRAHPHRPGGVESGTGPARENQGKSSVLGPYFAKKHLFLALFGGSRKRHFIRFTSSQSR